MSCYQPSDLKSILVVKHKAIGLNNMNTMQSADKQHTIPKKLCIENTRARLQKRVT